MIVVKIFGKILFDCEEMGLRMGGGKILDFVVFYFLEVGFFMFFVGL